jgi:hypothetical protein
MRENSNEQRDERWPREIGERADCPECGRRSVVPVIFGYPGSELADAYERGDVVLGGCVIAPGYDPTVRCTACNWSDADRRHPEE